MSTIENEDEEGQVLLTEKQVQQLSAKIFNNQDPSEWVRCQLELMIHSGQSTHTCRQTREASSHTIITGTFNPFEQGLDDSIEDLSLVSFGTSTVGGKNQVALMDIADSGNASAPRSFINSDRREDTVRLLQEANHNLQAEVRSLRDKMVNMEVDMNAKISNLNQEPYETSRIPRTRGATGEMRGTIISSMMFRNLSNFTRGFDEDTFAIMMISNPRSKAWLLGLSAFTLQIVLGILIAIDQIKEGTESSVFNIPFKVDLVVHVGQSLTIILCVATQSDVLTAMQCFVCMGKGSDWREHICIGVLGTNDGCGATSWFTRIALPNILKLIQGILVILISFVIIVQSDNIIDLLKDFTALMVLSEADNILFQLADLGFLGRGLQSKAATVKELEFSDDSIGMGSTESPRLRNKRKTFFIRSFGLLILFAPVFGGWLGVLINQLRGHYFSQQYEGCEMHFSLAVKYFGDGKCYGGPLNTIECGFEGGDCKNFNQAYPLCKGDSLTSVEEQVGDGTCNADFNKIECDFDGGDCSFSEKFPDCAKHKEIGELYVGDGKCYGGPLNTLECEFEGGDCMNFNMAYPLCSGDDLTNVQNEVGNGTCNILFANYECDFDGGDCCPYNIFKSSKFGDGLCNGGKISTKSCGFDGGDCNALLREYPDCPLDEIANIEGSSDIILGDGICEGAMYKSELCGREFRDCDVGQLGQDITLHGVASGATVDLRVRMTGDGSKLMIGMPGTDLNDKWNATSAGQLRFFDYDNEGDIWAKSLPDLVGKNADDRFGFSMAMNHDGSQVVVGSHRYNGAFGKVNAYRFSTLQDRWVQLGQTLNGPPTGRWGGYTVDMTKDGSRVALSAPLYKLNDENVQAGKIQVFELDSSARAWNQIGQDINGGNRMLIGYFFLEFDLSGSRVYFSSGFSDKPAISVKVYEHNKQANEWVQLGGDIPNPYPRKTQRPPISADGSRIAVASNIAKGSEDPSQVQVFDLDMSKGNATWVQVGTTLTGSNEQDPDGFGYNVDFDSSGSLLAIASLNPNCLGSPEWCPTGSIKLYRYSPNNQPSRVFSEVPFKQIGDSDNVMQAGIREFDKSVFGGEMLLSDDGSKISVVGYDFVNNYGFVKVYNVDDLFFSECVVPDPSIVGNGNCADFEPYYTEECGYDGGDCGEPIKVDEFENCYVRTPKQLGNGVCVDDFPYNSKECGYDGGDCTEPVEVEGYPGCFVRNAEEIGNGRCVDQVPYGSPECGFDGGDCLNK